MLSDLILLHGASITENDLKRKLLMLNLFLVLQSQQQEIQ